MNNIPLGFMFNSDYEEGCGYVVVSIHLNDIEGLFPLPFSLSIVDIKPVLYNNSVFLFLFKTFIWGAKQNNIFFLFEEAVIGAFVPLCKKPKFFKFLEKATNEKS